MKAHFDLDCVKYAAASAGESRSVLVTHKSSKKSIEVPNRTAFYGHWKKKEGGMLAEINSKRESPFTWDEFEYEDIQRPEPIENVLHTAKLMVEKAIEASGASDTKFYIGKGESFRVELSTLLKYKDQRSDMLKPVLLDEVTDYLKNKFKAEVITYYEVDDLVVMNTWLQPKDFVLGLDKDYYSSGIKFFNINRPEEGIVDNNCLGKLYLNHKGDVKGYGRLFKYFQCITQDNSDNYKANCFSDVKWADKSGYEALKDCTSDKEAWQVMWGVFNKLYPEQKTVVGWRGDSILIDALYVFQEMVNMAHLHRKENDFLCVRKIMDSLGVDIESKK